MDVTEITTCDERVFEDRNGLFTVLFSNNSGLDMDEIEEIFSEYGNVWLVRRAGDERGIHFVTFESYDEAKCAVDGLENHPDIQLKVYLNKAKSRYNQRPRQFNDGYNNNNYNNNRWSKGYDNDAPPRNNRWHRSQNNGYYNGREEYVERRERRYVNDWADDNYARNFVEDNKMSAETSMEEVVSDESVMSVEFEKEVVEKSVEPVKEVVEEESEEESAEPTREIVADARENYEKITNESEESSPSYNVQNYLAAYNPNNLSASNETVDATINTAEGEHSVITCQEEPAVKVAETEVTAQPDIEVEDDQVSIASEESIEPVVLDASEVIVGNINLNTDEAYVLHLFNMFEPLAVSKLVPVSPGAEVQYCSLYFKDPAVAARVEKLFDRLCLGGRQIVVQRPNRLIATYMQQM